MHNGQYSSISMSVCQYQYAVCKYKFSLVLGMSDFEICVSIIKYLNYCKYYNIHLVDYNSAVKLKLQAYTKSHFLYKHQPCLYTNLNSFYCLSYAWSTVLLFQNAFCQPSKITTGGMAPMKGSNMAMST